MSDFEKAKQSAEEVLKENFVTRPPVHVIELVKNYGYKVLEIELSPDIAGFVNPSERVIYVNISDSDTRKAFTVAHELGHIRLHASELTKNPDIGILYRKPLGKKDDNEKEQEANCFAASLLVPESMYMEILEQYKDVLNEDNKKELLSTLFGVSQEVIGYRLHDFNFKE